MNFCAFRILRTVALMMLFSTSLPYLRWRVSWRSKSKMAESLVIDLTIKKTHAYESTLI